MRIFPYFKNLLLDANLFKRANFSQNLYLSDIIVKIHTLYECDYRISVIVTGFAKNKHLLKMLLFNKTSSFPHLLVKRLHSFVVKTYIKP